MTAAGPPLSLSRRDALRALALAPAASLLGGGAPPRLHHAPRARSVIYLHMAGSPPQHDLFDWKPALQRYDRKPCPEEFLRGERFAFIKGHPRLLATPYRFARHGDSGAWVSELLPHLAAVVDKLAIVRSMRTDEFNHAPAQLLLHTGSPRFGRACIGAWVLYGRGSACRDLPGFVVLVSGGKTPSAGKSVWGSGFLPSVHQGCQLRSDGDPVLFLSDPAFVDRAARRRSLDAIVALNDLRRQRLGDPEIDARSASYELAYRMQAAMPEAVDLAGEDPATLAAYGAEPGRAASFANHCLLARRLVERGVRFVQLYDWGWDAHGTGKHDDLMHQLPLKARQVDRPIAALIGDLEQRGLLDETLVVWSGEFGRTPMNEERDGSRFLGRDHHPHCFTVLLAGGGVRRGLVHGATDELGYRITDGEVHVHDLQATMLHLLGFDHERLTYRFEGRDFRLTDVHGRVAHELLA